MKLPKIRFLLNDFFCSQLILVTSSILVTHKGIPFSLQYMRSTFGLVGESITLENLFSFALLVFGPCYLVFFFNS